MKIESHEFHDLSSSNRIKLSSPTTGLVHDRIDKKSECRTKMTHERNNNSDILSTVTPTLSLTSKVVKNGLNGITNETTPSRLSETSTLSSTTSPPPSPTINSKTSVSNGISSLSSTPTTTTTSTTPTTPQTMATTATVLSSSPRQHHPYGGDSGSTTDIAPPYSPQQAIRTKNDSAVIGGGGGSLNARGSNSNGVIDFTQPNKKSSTGYNMSSDISRIAPVTYHTTSLTSTSTTLTTPVVSAMGGLLTNNTECRTGQGIGGRLQFFKDGKFILELARAKEGERGGWVSVPRKHFRSPSTTSSTITPTYPKNESSTSLSFSDDNSSIQSSPWQRDHCWKQLTPRRGISNELCLYYKRAKQLALTANGLKTARKKRRRPFDTAFMCSVSFRISDNNSCESSTISPMTMAQEISSEKDSVEVDESDIPSATILSSKSPNSSSPSTENCSEIQSADSNTEIRDCVDAATKIVEPTVTVKSDECDVKSPTLPLSSSKIEKTPNSSDSTNKENSNKSLTASKQINGEKRLKEPRPRAKLSTIIQKLIDRQPTGLFYLSKIPQIISGTISNNGHSNISASCAPSSLSSTTVASRLAEQHYHQQHVSPRKRILREFEKVTLEDNAVGSSKRSRAKGNSTTISAVTSLTNSSTTNSNQRVQSSGCAILSSSTANYENLMNINGGTSKNDHPTNTSASSAPKTTRLYSSYSIHSLLGGNNNVPTPMNSNNNNTNSGRKNSKIDPSPILNQQQNQQSLTDPSYLRNMLASPKSPDAAAGGAILHAHSQQSLRKSSFSPASNYASVGGNTKKRSPPYSSPLHDYHLHSSRNQSPTIDAAGGMYNRSMRSPPTTPTTVTSNRSTSPHQQHPSAASTSPMGRISENIIASAPSPNQHFYSPYSLSPKYTSASNRISPNPTVGNDYSNRQKHEHLRVISSSSTSNRSPSFSAFSNSGNNTAPPRELSPPNRVACNISPAAIDRRDSAVIETAPRTVPKKTVSIRKQFASPSISTTITASAVTTVTANNNAQHTVHNRHKMSTNEDISPPDHRKTPSGDSNKYNSHQNLSSAAATQAILQRSSPVGSSVGSVSTSSPLFYMYPPNGGSPSPHPAASSSSPSTTSYIPSMSPYYHPYVSTLAALRNPLWMHHAAAATGYPPSHGAQQSPQSPASTRLSPPFQHFPYNGVGAAAVAAAAAAAALHSPFTPMHFAAAAGHHHATQLQQQHHQHPHHHHHHHQLTTLSPQAAHPGLASAHSPMTDHRIGAMSPNSIKDEHSLDVPLNLSKH